MPTMSSELYDALLAAGAPEDKARAAAVAVADFQTRSTELRLEFADVRSTQRLHSWMLGFLIAISVATLFKAFLG
jgi:hypothetical protein